MNTLICKNIHKTYSHKSALSDVSLTLEANKIYGLIGRNGAGKTTLLSIMNAQNPPTSGTVTLDGEAIWENQKALNHLCFSRELSPTTILGLDARKVKSLFYAASIFFPYWDKDYANRLVTEFNLDTKKRISQLSKGMLSMVTIIIALASKAAITLLDEPVAGLDVFMREKFYALLLEEYTQTGRTFVISTHIIEEAAGIFEEVIVIDKGKVIEIENTETLMANYRYVSGKDSIVDAATAPFTIAHTESLGRNKNVCIRLDGKDLSSLATQEVDVSPVPLQKIFMYLTEEVNAV